MFAVNKVVKPKTEAEICHSLRWPKGTRLSVQLNEVYSVLLLFCRMYSHSVAANSKYNRSHGVM